MITDAVTELDHKTVHRRLTVPDRHGPFLRGILDCQVHHLHGRYFSGGIPTMTDLEEKKLTNMTEAELLALVSERVKEATRITRESVSYVESVMRQLSTSKETDKPSR